MTINIKVVQAITNSINVLRSNLTKAELSEVKNAFDNIYRYKIDVSGGYSAVFQNKNFDIQKSFQIEDAFYKIANHITIPSRTGTTNLLDSVYLEDTSNSKIEFMEYQQEVIGYVHDQVSNLDG